MKKIVKILMIISLVIFIKLLSNFIINESVISNYNKEIYNNQLVKLLYLFNINEPYIAYYNEGNLLYKIENYEEAIKKYNKALEKNPPLDKVCYIQVNLSLSKIKNIDLNDSNVKSKLDEAQKILYQNDCANPNDRSGRSIEAENLDDEINKLKEENKSDDNNQDDNNDDKNQENNNEEDIEQQLKENESKANESRQESLDRTENIGKFEYYSGKRW